MSKKVEARYPQGWVQRSYLYECAGGAGKLVEWEEAKRVVMDGVKGRNRRGSYDNDTWHKVAWQTLRRMEQRGLVEIVRKPSAKSGRLRPVGVKVVSSRKLAAMDETG